MVHSDILNSLTDDEKIILLACIQHATRKEYQYDQLQWIRKPFLKYVLEKYGKIVKKGQVKSYTEMVDKINLQLKSL